jgi:hypothetical protein
MNVVNALCFESPCWRRCGRFVEETKSCLQRISGGAWIPVRGLIIFEKC